MRSKFLGLSLAFALSVPAALWAALCDDTYNLQSMTQTSFEGTDASALGRTGVKTVAADLSNLDVLDSSMSYGIISRFVGSCTKASEPITIKVKGRAQAKFTDSIDNSYMVQMFDTNTLVGDKKYDYWFGFFKPAATLRLVLGRTNSQGEAFGNWYLGIAYIDSTRNTTSGIWSATMHYYDLQGPDDSVSLEKEVLDQTIRKQPANSADHKAHYRVQFLKAAYENKPSPVKLAPSRPSYSNPHFQANQTGNLVFIQPGDKIAGTEPVGLYGMMGNKIATLHPTGYVYQWNGKTAAGADAPTGVYFVQAGNRILGKFFYAH